MQRLKLAKGMNRATGVFLAVLFSLMLAAMFDGYKVWAGQVADGWAEAYGGSDLDEATALVQTSGGGYALAGFTGSFGATIYDFWLVKTDSSGNALWNKTYGGTDVDQALALVENDGGGYVMAGSKVVDGDSNAWLIRTDSTGNALWNKTYGGTNVDTAWSLVKTVDGGYALAGSTKSFGAGDNDFWLVKTNATGDMTWNRTYGGINDDTALALVQTADGGYALAGYTKSFGAGDFDSWLVRTDVGGNMLWNKTYGGINIDDADDLVQTADGGYALAGSTGSFGAGTIDFWLVVTNATGDIIWDKTYGGLSHDYAVGLVQTVDGGYAIAGYTNSFGAGDNDFWLVKTNAAGNILWTHTYGGTRNDEARAFVQTADGGYALVGYTSSLGAGGDAWLVKTDASGVVPELPSVIIQAVVLVTVLLAAVLIKRKHRMSLARSS